MSFVSWLSKISFFQTCAFGSLVIALLCLSQQEKDKAKIKMPILPDPQDGRCP